MVKVELTKREYFLTHTTSTVNAIVQCIERSLGNKQKVMDVARSAPQVAHYHSDVIYLLP